MRIHPVPLIFCALAVVSCARPISVKVTTTPVDDVELTLNRPALGDQRNPSTDEETDPYTAQVAQENKLRTAHSQCVIPDVSQGRDLTIVARKEGYEVTSVTIPAKAEPVGVSLLWSPRAWSSLIWSSTSPRAHYLVLEDENHQPIDLEETGIIIPMKKLPESAEYTPEKLPDFDERKMNGGS